MTDYNVMLKIHVWMGVADSEAAVDDYFRVDLASRDAGLGASQFDRDIGREWYEDDLIGVFYCASPSLEACLDELPTSARTVARVRAAYLATGSPAPNAMFYYTNSDLVIANPHRLFNHLHYLGVFDNS